jgi:hypothetical protein
MVVMEIFGVIFGVILGVNIWSKYGVMKAY